MQTQWRVGVSGASGLDYAGVAAYLTEAGHDGEARREIFAGIQAAERETLKVWSEQRQRNG